MPKSPVGTVLVTGSTGLIGAAVCKKLEADGFDVIRVLRGAPVEAPGRESVPLVAVPWPEGLQNLDLKGIDAIVHLALAPFSQSEPYAEVLRVMQAPIIHLLKAVNRTNPNCHFVFFTSQSAAADAMSNYGKAKFALEQFVTSKFARSTIVRPGLVVGPRLAGLFGAIAKVVELSPVVPLIGDGRQPIQPLFVGDLAQAVSNICRAPELHHKANYSLALPPVPFRTLLETVAKSRKLRRFYLPVPNLFVDFGLRVQELCFSNPPVSRSSLLGLLQLRVMDCSESLRALGIALTPLCPGVLLEAEPAGLRAEGRYFYSRIFGREPNELLLSRYEVGNRQLGLDAAHPSIERIVLDRLDVEAIEFRARRSLPLLSKKLTLLSYLAEVEQRNYSLFVNTRPQRVRAWLTLMWTGIRTVVLALKGEFLKRRYALV